MKRMQTWRWVPAALLLATGGTTAGRAEEFAIQSFDGTGQIIFDAVAGATNYQVKVAPTPTGTWSVAVGAVAPTSANTVTATVSMAAATAFYRVAAYTNVAPSSGGMYLVVDLTGSPSYPVTYLDAVPPGGWTDEHKTTKLVLRRIPATTPDFTMGGRSTDYPGASDSGLHQVTLTSDFYLGVFEVTQRQWELVMGNNPSYFSYPTYYTHPVERVSYFDIRENPTSTDDPAVNWPANSAVNANSFMGKLRAKTGLSGFDLPTESQWEYACRAGTTTALNSGYNLTSTSQDMRMDEVGRYKQDSTVPVGSYLANAWGLFDMHGNVWEWCLDWHEITYPGTVTDPPGASSGSYRVFRGGSWLDPASSCRSAYRDFWHPYDRLAYFGFRACCAPPGQL